MAKVVYLHFSEGAAHDAQRAAYKDVDAAVAEAAHLLANYPGRTPKPIEVRDEDGNVLADKKQIQAAAKKAQ